MRLNQFIAQATGMSRRAADRAIENSQVKVNSRPADIGMILTRSDLVTLDGNELSVSVHATTIMLNKPVGYVCSREGQGAKTIYDLLPKQYHKLKPVGRLDKDSSGLLLLTNDGQLAHKLTHPSFKKQKVYEVTLGTALPQSHQNHIESGVQLEDGISRMKIFRISDFKFRALLHEGRNRQIRRTFQALGYKVIKLHRTQFGPYKLNNLSKGKFLLI